MGFFDSESTTNVTNNNRVENQHATAGADGFAAGANSNIRIEEVSDDIAKAAFDLNKDVAYEAFDLNRDVASRGFDLASDTVGALADSQSNQVNSFLGFAADFVRQQNASTESERTALNDQAKRTTELIAAQAGVVAPASTEKQQLAFAGVVLVLAGFAIFKKSPVSK